MRMIRKNRCFTLSHSKCVSEHIWYFLLCISGPEAFFKFKRGNMSIEKIIESLSKENVLLKQKQEI